MEGLGINWATFLAQIANFIILLVILRLFAYKPFINMMEQRSNRIRESLAEAEKVKQEAAKAEDDFKKRLESASKEGQEVIARAMRTGEEARQRALLEAKQDAQALVERARAEIQRERDEAINELRGEFADLTITAAEKVIEKSLDKQAHQQIIEKVLEESSTLKPKG
ncbi:MAG: F0F1 ATP synthase subunit B [Dehalococcoidia bacterium]|nr:F0F1 ATP synthase subunit B [Dehalococcoidia bacterium]